MDLINAPLRAVLGGYVSLFGDAHPLVSLTPLSILLGVAMLWVVGKTSNQEAIERAKKKMQAYLLELRLFGDDPGLLFSSQAKLIGANFRYIGLMFQPALVLTVPMIVVLFHLDAIYGIRPFEPGETAVVTIKAAGRLGSGVAVPELQAPEGVTVETPAVRALEPGEFSWRLRPQAAASGDLAFRWNGHEFTKSIEAGDGRLRYLSWKRASSFLGLVESPGESALNVENLDSIELLYPPAEIETGGLRLHWLVWFLVLSIAAGFALKDYFGVVV